ncbi:MAG: DUF559 domain-containing protein [Betaproteobacteria bacterium]|nr:DUF559 domain-containing protein [Betaproteobacteria bacterium]
MSGFSDEAMLQYPYACCEPPLNWSLVAIRDIAVDVSPGFASGKHNSNGTGVPHLRPMNVTRDGEIDLSALKSVAESNGTELQQGDVLFNNTNSAELVGKTAVVSARESGYAFSNHMTRIRPEVGVNSIFMARQLHFLWLTGYMKYRCTHHVNQASISSKTLAVGIPFLLPPAEEQTRIVEKLEELLSDLDAGVAELKAAQKKLAQYRQSLLKAAVEGALTAEWRKARAPLPPRGGGVGGEGAMHPAAASQVHASGNTEAMSGHAVSSMALTAPLPPCGGGVGGEGAHTRQLTPPLQQQHARTLRREQTPQEQALWQQLRGKRFGGFKFRRQQPLGRYIADFVCFEKRLIVELDGGQHAQQQEYDAARDAWLREQGFRVLRFWNSQWQAEQGAVLDAIWRALNEEAPPLPNPSPARGEGLACETGAQLLERILKERRARWEAKQLAKFEAQGKTPPKDWQKKYPEPVAADTTGLPELPQGWVWASLDMLGDIASGVAKGTKTNGITPTREVPYLRVANVQRGYLDLSEVKTILATQRDIEELTLMNGDVLFNEGGDRDKLGRGWVWRSEISECIHQNHVFRMRPYLPEVLPELISHHGNTFGQLWFQNAGKQTTNLASINMTMLRAFPVPVAPADEQMEILEQIRVQLDILEQQESATELAMKQSAAQRQNILRAAFAGQLVPQHPNDEPASVLLERIRSERAARKSPGKPRVHLSALQGVRHEN